MRWVTYTRDATTAVGLLDDDVVVDAGWSGTMLDLVRSGVGQMHDVGEHALARRRVVHDLSSVELRLPFRPITLRDCAGFLQHLRNNASVLGGELDPRFLEYPPFYFANVVSAIGPNDPVAVPPRSTQLDFELEIAAVIGVPGRDIPVESAKDHIAGYMIFCDWSARDLGLAERGLFGQMKGKDFANSLGPALVTPDELTPFEKGKSYDLAMTAELNGDQVANGNWSTMEWGFDDMIAFASRGVALEPGEVFGSGTVPTGCLLEDFSHDPVGFRGWLQPGDELTLRVEQLGSMTIQIINGASNGSGW
jgi:2-keto-4-pentenoate hydratase/2-oxohepta-3-ene-1,7-dioic acid hydratase in catechol pathway